ncbi:type II toxin-antitoxin system RelE/ParE family toxin [Promicromonospora sp. NPDC019610]
MGFDEAVRARRVRIAVNDHRVIYEISDSQATVTVVKIGNRRDVYRGW